MTGGTEQKGNSPVEPTREELALAVDEAEWGWIRAHLERGGIIIVGPALDIADVGLALAVDDSATIREWITEKKLTKPTAEQIATWDRQGNKRFQTLIVSPFVLIQEAAGKTFHC